MGLDEVGVDQSGKVDKTELNTAIVWCPLDEIAPNYSLYVPKEVTRKVRQRIYPQFKTDPNLRKRWFGPKMYAVSLYYLFKGAITDIERIHMEIEYEGHSDSILDTLDNWFRNEPTEFSRQKFIYPTDKADFKAHELSNLVREGEKQASRKLDFKDFRQKMLPSRLR